jgi:hypothetical protein
MAREGEAQVVALCRICSACLDSPDADRQSDRTCEQESGAVRFTCSHGGRDVLDSGVCVASYQSAERKGEPVSEQEAAVRL